MYFQLKNVFSRRILGEIFIFKIFNNQYYVGPNQSGRSLGIHNDYNIAIVSWLDTGL